jgi:hypothetical protein
VHKLVLAIATIALLAAPAYGQARGKGGKHSDNSQQTQEQKEKNAAAEKAYQDALKSIPDQKNSDPWAKMR